MGNPARIEQFFAYATLWVDSEGFRVQGDSHRNFATALQKRITVGAVYKVTCYALCPPRSSFRACRFPHCIQITPSTKFELQPPTDPPFLHDAYDFVEFPLLRDRLPPSPYLADPTYVYFLLVVFGLYALADFLLIFPCFPDLVGKVVGVGKPNHVDSNAKTAPVQTIRLADAGGSEVKVSLWSELAYIIDPDTVTLDDVSAPVIIGFSCVRISTFDGEPKASTCLATRIIMQPVHPVAERLHEVYASLSFVFVHVYVLFLCLRLCSIGYLSFVLRFTKNARPITYVPPKFDTPEKLEKHIEESFRTIQQLQDLYKAGGDSEPRYRCIAKIRGVDSQQHWCYRSCPHCSCAAAPNGVDFWCPTHDTISSADITYRYKLKLYVSDSTTETMFVLLGQAADRILPISAMELIRAYPDVYGELPPPIGILVDQTVTFEVQLPRHLHANTYGDFKVSKIWGLKIPRDKILSQIPKPLPLPLPSPNRGGQTPLPPDPRYVPPVYTGMDQSASASIPLADLPSPSTADNPGDQPFPADVHVSQPIQDAPPPSSSSSGKSPMVVQLTVQKSHPKAAPKSHKKKTPSVATKKSPLNESTIPMHLASSTTPLGLLDDVPLRFFARAKRLSKDTLAPPTPDAANLSQSKPAKIASAASQSTSSKLSNSPLARVKREKLDALANCVGNLHGAPSGTDSSSDDDDHQSLRSMARIRSRKRLFTA